jgi:hypothetical protein
MDGQVRHEGKKKRKDYRAECPVLFFCAHVLFIVSREDNPFLSAKTLGYGETWQNERWQVSNSG